MTVTGVSPELREPLFTQVARIVGSEVLRGSESLCHLLEFLASHAISNPGNPVKEYQIATEVFGRSEKFDPRLDSAVRVQTSRLRAKLAEYYAGPGAGDPMVIEIPKGAYSLTVHEKAAPEPPAIPAPPPPYREPARPARPGAAAWFLGILCLGQCAAILYMLTRPPKPAAEVQPLVPPALRALWDPFIESHERSWIVFSNAEFVGRPETGMRYLNPATDKSSPILDHYTGVGEVMAIHELDRLFAQFRRSVVVKRGRLLAMDDVKNNDVVFVGSPSENLALRDMPALQDFVFGRTPGGDFRAPLRIANLHPAAGEQALYFASPGLPITQDYAVIALLPGLAPQHWVMSVAGISTIGTQAAVEFVCSESSVEKLVALARKAGSHLSPFEALLHVNISRGVPVASELVAVHNRK